LKLSLLLGNHMKLFFGTLLLISQGLFAVPTEQDCLKAAKNPDYYKHVILKGKVRQMVFPGPPHFLSVEDGDWEEPRTVLEVDKESLVRLVEAQSKVTSDHYMGEFIDSTLTPDEPSANLVTMDSSFTGKPDNIEFYENKTVTIDAVISAQPARCHTPFVVEIVEVLSHE
jgi:hypothetical protein